MSNNYKLTSSGQVRKNISENSYIIMDTNDPEYISWLSQGNTPDPAETIPLAIIKENCKKSILDYIDLKCDLVKYGSFLAEQQSWPTKLRDAENVVNNVISPLNSPLLVEALLRPSTMTNLSDKVVELAQLIIFNAQIYRNITYIFTGYRTFLFTKIEILNNKQDSDNLIAQSKFEIDNIFNYLLANDQNGLNAYIAAIITPEGGSA